MKSAKEISLEAKILRRVEHSALCTKLVKYLIDDEELQSMQDYSNNVSIKRLGYNDHGPVHMRQVVANAIKMLNILNRAGVKTSLEEEEIGTYEDSLCAVILSGFMHDYFTGLDDTAAREALEAVNDMVEKTCEINTELGSFRHNEIIIVVSESHINILALAVSL